jgi:creatinine amidohydrolase
MRLSSRHWWDLTTAQFAALDMNEVVVLQPVAAVEQHGPHLPVLVDAAINAGIVSRALELAPADLPLLVLRSLPVGKSNEHSAFPGTLTFSYETLGRAWFEIGESVNRAGCRKIIFFNSHGGQPQLVDIICRELRVRLGMFAIACSWFHVVDLSDLFDATELRHGIHAGAIETSVMQRLHPDLVDMTKARNFVSLAERIEQANPVLRSEGLAGAGPQCGRCLRRRGTRHRRGRGGHRRESGFCACDPCNRRPSLSVGQSARVVLFCRVSGIMKATTHRNLGRPRQVSGLF